MRITNERDDLALENMQLRASLDVRLNEIAQLESIRDKYERERVTTCEPND